MTTISTDIRAVWRDSSLGTERELRLPSGSLHVFDRGSGDPILLIHGLVVNANLWRAVVPELAHAFRCVTIDLPFGSHRISMPGTPVDPPGLAGLVIETIEAMDLGPVTLVGNDSGGVVCQLVAARRPDLVARMVLTSCDAYDNFPPKTFAYLKLAARVPAGMAILAAALRFPAIRALPIAYGWLSRVRIDRRASDSYALPVAVTRDIRDDLRRVLRGLDKRHTRSTAETFADFDRPVLLAWSEDDRFFPTQHAHRMAADYPDARIHWIPGARTLSPEDEPAALADAIVAFAAGAE
ncbi:alpha/beta fold hydrolase [Nocardia jejuensis]|uniref:alpha/beta fold hydrolase n=1 Tax=Nocardia jejuensis TaxID=328049 RepID=UPI00082CC4A9|nr:alpha/beta hydrolase [Nocardia jejuensis]